MYFEDKRKGIRAKKCITQQNLLLHTHLSQSYLYVRVTQRAYCSSYLVHTMPHRHFWAKLLPFLQAKEYRRIKNLYDCSRFTHFESSKVNKLPFLKVFFVNLVEQCINHADFLCIFTFFKDPWCPLWIDE